MFGGYTLYGGGRGCLFQSVAPGEYTLALYHYLAGAQETREAVAVKHVNVVAGETAIADFGQ